MCSTSCECYNHVECCVILSIKLKNNLSPIQATLCLSALVELRKSSTGKAVEYDNLVEKLISDVIPNHFGLEMTEEGKQNILTVSKTYSKNKGQKSSEWKEDSEKKEQRASEEIVDASELFMSKSYAELQTFATN